MDSVDNDVGYFQKLNDDLISQFKNQPNTKVLMAAIAKQLLELRQAQEQLNDLRHLAKAQGRQLDGIGDIVVLTRTDAARYELGRPNASEIDDEVFRKYLFYKIFLNTSTGTRKEIMRALRFFWNEAPLYYSEDPAFPATIFVDTPELAPSVPIEGLLEAPIVKPAGVRFIVRINTKTDNEQHNLRFVGLSVAKTTKTQISETEHPIVIGQFKSRLIGLSIVKTTVTEIPEAEQIANNSEFNLRVTGLSTIKNTKTQIPEAECKVECAELKLHVIGSAVVKATKTTLPETVQGTISKQMHITHSPQWVITHTDTSEYTSVAKSTQQYKGLATTKITNTPLAAYGGD